jgi:hypothetical protein
LGCDGAPKDFFGQSGTKRKAEFLVVLEARFVVGEFGIAPEVDCARWPGGYKVAGIGDFQR